MIDEWLKDPSKVSVVAILLGAVTAFVREWVVPGTAYRSMLLESKRREDQLTKERDEFRDMALRGLELTRRSIDVAQKVKEG